MRENCECKIVLGEGAVLPEKKHPDDAGYDICSNVDIVLEEHSGPVIVSTGIFIEPTNPEWYIQVVPRSGLAANKGITVLNTPGTIDSNYRNEIKVIMINHSDSSYEIHKGDRIAQMIFTPSYSARFVVVDELGDSDRGLGGIGSTGR